MLAGFFLKKVVFTFSESGLFFSFSLFFVLTCCKLGALDFIILLRFHSNRIIQTRIFLYVCKTPAAVAAAAAPAEPAAATPPPQRPPPPRPSPPWSPPNEPPSPPRRFGLRTQIQTSIFCTGVVSEIQNDTLSLNLDFLGCQHWNEQLRFFKILEYTGRYGFPEILIEVRAPFLELTSKKWWSPNVAKSEEKTSHRFGIVVLKTEISVSRPIENSGVEWVLDHFSVPGH